MQKIRAAGNPEPLTDKVTGPIPQTGKSSRAEFTWDFERTRDCQRAMLMWNIGSRRPTEIRPARA